MKKRMQDLEERIQKLEERKIDNAPILEALKAVKKEAVDEWQLLYDKEKVSQKEVVDELVSKMDEVKRAFLALRDEVAGSITASTDRISSDIKQKFANLSFVGERIYVLERHIHVLRGTLFLTPLPDPADSVEARLRALDVLSKEAERGLLGSLVDRLVAPSRMERE